MSGALSKVPVSPSSINAALRDAEPRPFWLDDPDAPDPRPPLTEALTCDLLVGGGFTGLWTAILAKEENPTLDVVLVEGERIGWAATGRNGGFVSSSLTHGLPNGVDRFASELPTLLRLGDDNLDAIEQAIDRYGIDAQWERTGEITAAYEPWQVDELGTYAEMSKEFVGVDVELWDADRMRSEVHSPTYLGGAHEPHHTAVVNPGRLAWGLAQAAENLGVRIFERSKVTGLTDHTGQMVATAGYGRVSAPKVALATNIFPNLVRRARSFVIPVWDYVLMTEPLSDQQMDVDRVEGPAGNLSDLGNQFHYYRLSADNRILWGGYDAIYY